MHGLDFLRDILVYLGAAVVCVYLSRRVKTSPVLGYLLAGIIIGPEVAGLISNVKGSKSLAELGVVFLLFSIGLELSFKRLKTMRGEVFGLGGAQVVITGGVIATILWLLGISGSAAVVIGFGVALSSTAIVLQVLSERREMASRVGRTSFSILLMQDIAIVPLLALLPLMGGDKGGETDWAEIGLAALKAAAAVAAILFAGRFLLQPLFRAVANLKTQEVFIAIVLLSVLGTAWATEQVGLSMTLGAFLAGLMLAETEFRHQVEVDIRPFQGLLMGLFFITIGMSVDLRFAANHWAELVSLLLALLVVKAAIIFTLCRLTMGLSTPLSLRVGLMLAQGGEFALVLIAVAVSDHLVTETVSQYVLATVSLSMAATPFLAILGKWLEGKFNKVTPIGLASLEKENADLEGHLIIAGYGRVGRTIARLAEAHNLTYVILDLNPQRVAAGKAKSLPIYFGDTSRLELLWGLGIDRARAFVSTVDEDPGKVTALVRSLRGHLPDLQIIARARDEDHAESLTQAGATAAVPDMLASSLHIAQSVMGAFDLPASDIASILAQTKESKSQKVAA